LAANPVLVLESLWLQARCAELKTIWLLVLLLSVVLGTLASADSTQRQETTISSLPVLMSSSGSKVEPIENDERKATLFYFIATTCPISNTYAPDISRISTEFLESGVKSYAVLTDESLTPAEAATYKSEYNLTCPVVLDPLHKLVARVGATVTPEAVVIDRKGRLIYRGRIDNKFVDFGVSRPTATLFDLVSVLHSIVAGRSVGLVETKAIGCFIEPPAQ
jgi:peroxiredoxin